MNASMHSKATNDDLDLVYGLGNTGLSIARYLQRSEIRARLVRFVDSRAEPPGARELHDLYSDAQTVFGEVPKALLKNTTRIIVSPGIADTDSFLEEARVAGVEIVSDIELFAREARAPFVAVTGSNGKSTVTTLLALMCESAGKKVLAGGNLGVPALDLLIEENPDYYLLELSSFQLQRTRNLPARVAVLLNISPDHLDWHVDEAEYRAAKYRVFAQAEAAVINRADAETALHVREEIPQVSFGLDTPAAKQYGLRDDEGRLFLARGEQLLLAIDEVAMVGAHNIANALAALAVGELIGLDMPSMLQVLNEFPGLPHRMQRVAERNGVAFINDSKATNVGAAIAAVQSVDGAVILIAGGQGKGGDFHALAKSTCKKLKGAVLLGEDKTEMQTAFAKYTPTVLADDMRDAVFRAAETAESGDTILLAPACASFDQYSSYQERGKDFCNLVEALPR